MSVNITGPCWGRTRGGDVVEIKTLMGGNDFQLVYSLNGKRITIKSDGKYFLRDMQSPYDIVEILPDEPEPVTVENPQAVCEPESINNGGPAFPWSESHPQYGTRGEPGMSLRDWFAGMAMSGFAADPAMTKFEDVVHNAYKLADAMLKARGQ